MTGSVWVASYVLLWVAVVVLGLAVAACLRQIGVLHARLRPMGVHFAGEGPERLQPAPLGDLFPYGAAPLSLLAFTSPTCTICERLVPSLRALERQYGDALALHVVDHGPATLSVFNAFKVTSTPYVVAVDRDGIVQGRGVANTLEQVEELVAESMIAEDRRG